jgi:uncharacterized membrane protein HdeD (DUF308 family)
MSHHRPSVSSAEIPPSVEATGRLLRTLYLFRAAFSFAWVAFVYSFASSAGSDRALGLVAGVFLIAYPVSDAVASLVELPTRQAAHARWPHYANMIAGFGAAAGIGVFVLSDLATAINVFGVWAVVSGALQVYLAVRRRHTGVRGQWPMILSGSGSLVAGITFIDWVGTSHTGLTTVAQYSAGGAIWYVLTVLWLAFTRTAGPSRLTTRPRTSAEVDDLGMRGKLDGSGSDRGAGGPRREVRSRLGQART